MWIGTYLWSHPLLTTKCGQYILVDIPEDVIIDAML